MHVFTINVRIFSRARAALSHCEVGRTAKAPFSRGTAEIVAVILISGLLFAGLTFLTLEFLRLVIWLMRAVFYESVFSEEFDIPVNFVR